MNESRSLEGKQEKVPHKLDKYFMVIPNDENKTMNIVPTMENTSIQLDVRTAQMLVNIINHQIQQWEYLEEKKGKEIAKVTMEEMLEAIHWIILVLRKGECKEKPLLIKELFNKEKPINWK